MLLPTDARRCAIVLSMASLILAGAACSRPSGESTSPAGASASRESVPPPSKSDKLASTDLYHLRSVGDVQLTPDAARIAYSVVNNDRPGRPYSQIWIMNLASRESTRLGSTSGSASSPRWSPDSRSIAYLGSDGERHGLMIANADGSNAHPFVERDAPNTVLEAPQWAASGQVYYTVRRVTPNGREAQSMAAHRVFLRIVVAEARHVRVERWPADHPRRVIDDAPLASAGQWRNREAQVEVAEGKTATVPPLEWFSR